MFKKLTRLTRSQKRKIVFQVVVVGGILAGLALPYYIKVQEEKALKLTERTIQNIRYTFQACKLVYMRDECQQFDNLRFDLSDEFKLTNINKKSFTCFSIKHQSFKFKACYQEHLDEFTFTEKISSVKEIQNSKDKSDGFCCS